MGKRCDWGKFPSDGDQGVSWRAMGASAELLGESSGIVTVRAKIRDLIAHAQRAGRLPPILIQGETGTGKGLVAQLIHREGPRRGGPFVDINCAAIPGSLLEAELFGFEQGAFTDARQAKPGLFQMAHRGTLFLDEIGLLPPELQAKLLKAIEERSVRRLGGTRHEAVDVWVVSASSEDVAAATAAGRFRSDLYHRVSVVVLALPPLRERRNDIVLLANHFLTRASADYGVPGKTLAADAAAALLDYPWPGNIRELSNVMERVALLTESPIVTAEVLALREVRPPELRSRTLERAEHPLTQSVEEIERPRIVEALRQTGGNVSRAAARLRISRDQLRYRIEKYGLRPRAVTSPRPKTDARSAAGTAPPPDSAGPAPSIRWADQLLAVLRVTLSAAPAIYAGAELGRALEFLVEKVRSFGGRVEEMSPDGIIAVFGLDPSRSAATHAGFAALALQQAAMRAAATMLHGAAGKAAIRTGRFPVVHVRGTTGISLEAKRELLVALEALLARAEPGTTIVDGATAAFLDRRFDLVALGPTDDGAEPAYRLVRRKDAEFWGRLTTFVGRGHELALLHERLSSVSRGRGQAVGISGEPGIGKSRLLYEFCERARAEPAPRWLWAHCFAFTSNTSYLPILEMLRNLWGLGESETDTAIVEKVHAALEAIGVPAADAAPYLFDLLGVSDPARSLAGMSSDVVRARTFEALRQTFLSLSRTRSLGIVVEDLQWIDKTSEEFFASLVEDLPGAPILFLATYRAGYRPPWMDKSYAMQIALPHLAPEESQRLLAAVLPPDQMPLALAPVILARAEGNPFFLEEIARAVRPEAGLKPSRVPDTIEDVLMTRIDQLSREARNVLQIVAVCGREVSSLLLGAICNEPSGLDAAVRELVQREFVSVRRGVAAPVYVFTHALIQEVAYESLAADTRRGYHERIAHALSSGFTHLVDAQPELLAYHLTSAGLGTQAVQQWYRAGQQARRRSAFAEAITHLTRGLDLLVTLPADPGRSRQEIALQLSLGASLGALNGFGSAGVAQAYTRARHLCQEIGDSARLFSAMSGLEAFAFLKGDLGSARGLGEECLALAAQLGDASMLCRASNAMAGVLIHQGEPASGREHLQRAIAVVDKASDSASSYHSYVTHPLVFALSFDSWALWLLGYPDQALRTSQEALALAESLGHPHSTAFAHYLANVLRYLRRDLGVIRTQAETAIAFASEHGFPLYRALGVIMRGWSLAEHGSVADGLAEIRRGLADRLETGAGLGRPPLLGLLAATHARAGQPDAALEALAEAITVGRESTENVWEPDLLRQKGELLAADPIRDLLEAERAFRDAIALSRRQSARSWELRAATSLGRLLVRQNRHREARVVVGQAYDTFTEGFETPDLLEARAFLKQLAELRSASTE